MLEPTQDHEEIIQRVAACDIGKAELRCCVRVPDESRRARRAQEVSTYSTMTPALLALAQYLAEQGVTRVVMEATSDYWKPVYYLLEAHDFDVWLVNPRDVKHVPGRAKTDTLDAVWLAKLAERQMLRRSFVPDPPIRRLRDQTRYRADLVTIQGGEKQRVEKLLEDAQIKLSVVASDIFGVSGRAMMQALIQGQRDPVELAKLARGKLQIKHAQLIEALTGFFTEHHAFLLRRMLRHIDTLSGDIAALDQAIEEALAPFEQAISRMIELPGFQRTVAAAVLAEIGPDMTRFPTSGHLCSWAKLTPQDRQSGGKPSKGGSTGRGNPYLSRALGQAAMATGFTHTHTGATHRRLRRHKPGSKVLVATSRHLLVIVWHLLRDPAARYHDIGENYYTTRTNTDRQAHNHLRQLRALGYRVTIEAGVA